MKQNKLIKETYQACVDGDKDKQQSLFMKQLRKIFKRKEDGKTFTKPKWTILR